MYLPRHFATHEFVPQHIYEERGEDSIELIDDRLLKTADQLREEFGPITVNDWYWGGDRSWSGLRTPESPYYSPTSQHTFGRAMDGLFHNKKAEEVREFILKYPEKFPYITFLELDISWVHADVRNCKRIKTWSPKK